jgi:formylglycine-generating enzyme required for sulfatase activity
MRFHKRLLMTVVSSALFVILQGGITTWITWGEERVNTVGNPPLPVAEINSRDGAPMVLVPAGGFTMGSNGGDHDEKPPHEVELEAFYIDKYEVTTSRYAKFLQATGREKPKHWTNTVPVSHGDRPVVGITWDDAKAYCEKYGKRLPTEAEWEKAARGTDGREYPWGNSVPDSNRANFARFTNSWETDLYSKRLKPVGNYEEGKSPYGAYDMAGNVWEWVADWYAKNYYWNSPKENPKGPSNEKSRVVRGGSWSYYEPLALRAASRGDWVPSNTSESIGFRCAQDLD